jgi:hypothetical protein
MVNFSKLSIQAFLLSVSVASTEGRRGGARGLQQQSQQGGTTKKAPRFRGRTGHKGAKLFFNGKTSEFFDQFEQVAEEESAQEPTSAPIEPTLAPAADDISIILPEDGNSAVAPNCTIGGCGDRSLSGFAIETLPYIRVDDEAIDLSLDWESDELTLGDTKFLINPNMLFVDDGEGGYEWVRTVRVHSYVQKSNGQTTYEGQLLDEKLFEYKSSVLLSSETFIGDMTGGFDDQSIANWGLNRGQPMRVIDSSLYTNENPGKVSWETLCEPKPDVNAQRQTLIRKRVEGPEDPKLLELPSQDGLSSKWGLTFSSYPPTAKDEEDTCKWGDESVFRMYLAPDGQSLAQGDDAVANRLAFGEYTSDEKNWMAFTYENELYYIYSVEPHVIVKANAADGECERAYETSSDLFQQLSSRVSLRGSGTALRYNEDEYIAILHTKEKSTSEGGYATRAYKFEARPPFRIIGISKPLKLQSNELAFASSLTLVEDKVIVGYGVHDRESRVLVMSRAYLDEQFEEDCEGTLDQLIGQSGKTCAEQALSYMRGDDLMLPRRAMDMVGMEYYECGGLLSQNCKTDMLMASATVSNKVSTCPEAFARVAAGSTCSARAKWLIREINLTSEKAIDFIGEEFPECRALKQLGCTDTDLHWSEETCKPTKFNTYKNNGPTVLVTVGRSGAETLRPMMQCTGVSTELDFCDDKSEVAHVSELEDVARCLDEGSYHLVEARPKFEEHTAHSAVSKLDSISGLLGRRLISEVNKPKVLLVTGNPLDLIFRDLEIALGDMTMDAIYAGKKTPPASDDYNIRIQKDNLEEISSTAEGADFLVEKMVEFATQNMEQWEVMKTFVDSPMYETMMVTAEEVCDRVIQPSMLAEVSYFMGVSPDRESIMNGIQAMDGTNSCKQDSHSPEHVSSSEFYLGLSVGARGMPRICQMIERAPAFISTTAEQGYGNQLSELTAFCPGWDATWIPAAGDAVFVGISERM